MEDTLPYEPLGGGTPTPQPVQAGNNTPPPPIKPERPKKRRGFFSKTAFFMLFSFLVLAIGGYVIYKTIGIPSFEMPVPETPRTDNPATVDDNQTSPQLPRDDGWIEYYNKTDEIMIAYPAQANFSEPETPGAFNIYQVTVTGNRQSKPLHNDEDLEDGYLVRFFVQHDVANTDLTAIAIEKRNSFIIKCPETATITNIGNTTLSGFSGVSFSVENCGGNFIDTFVLRENDLVEVLQVFQGDLGYRQIYKNESSEVVGRFAFTNVIQATPKETWVEFLNAGYGIRFRYPAEMSASCCSVNGPISDQDQKIAVFGDLESVSQGSGQKFTGFGIFVEPNKEDIGFREYVEQQKQLLKENYRVVVGREPQQLTQEEIKISGLPAVVLKGYAWWGDVYIVQLMNQKSFLFISKTELHPGEFDGVFNDILGTFNLFNPLIK